MPQLGDPNVHRSVVLMLEQLADHDDDLLEQLLNDQVPAPETVFHDLARETGESLGVPLLFGSASSSWGVRRLFRHVSRTRSDVRSDIADEIHLHSYDLHADVAKALSVKAELRRAIAASSSTSRTRRSRRRRGSWRARSSPSDGPASPRRRHHEDADRSEGARAGA